MTTGSRCRAGRALSALLVVSLIGVGCGGNGRAPDPTQPPIVPTVTPTPLLATTVPEPDEPIVRSGEGNAATGSVALGAGLLVIACENDGEPLDIWMAGPGIAGGRSRAVVGATGGETYALAVPATSDYLFDVAATGAWTLTLRQPDAATGPRETLPLAAEGDGDTVIYFVVAPAGNHGVGASHRGDGPFVVRALDEWGAQSRQIIATEGGADIDAELRLDADALLVIVVEATGPWTLTIGNPAP